MTLIRLPIAPSVNAMYANNTKANNGRGRYKTDAYSSWKTEAGWILNQARVAPLGKMKVQLELSVNDAMKGDIDNRIKAVQDLLVTHRLIDDDKQVWRVSIEKVAASICKAREMLVSIEPYREKQE